MHQESSRAKLSSDNKSNYSAIQTQPDDFIDTQIEKKLVRKLDIRLIPWLAILYLLLSLDRNNIGNARLGTLEKDLNLVGNQYYTALTIFFAGYVLFHIPSNLLVKILKPSIWISSTTVIWGLCSFGQAFTTNAAGLITCRFFLGVFETGVGPATPLFLSFWYKRDELATRVAIYFGASTVAGAFAGAIAYAVLGSLEGLYGIAGWRWLFMVESIPTIVLGFFSFWVLPDMPENSEGWLNEKERQVAIQRTKSSGNMDSKKFDSTQFWAAWMDYKVWLAGKGNIKRIWNTRTDFTIFFNLWVAVVIYIGLNVALASFSIFLPTIIRDMGFNHLQAQILTIPPYVVACGLVFFVAWNSDRTLQRGYHVIAVSLLAISGYLLLLVSQTVSLRYTGAILVASGIYPIIPLTLSWVSNNQLGHTKRAVAIAMTSMIAQCFSMVGTQIYRVEDQPRYTRGHAVCLAFLSLGLISAGTLRGLLARENKRRDRVYGLPESNDLSLLDLEGVYDNHPQFRYAL